MQRKLNDRLAHFVREIKKENSLVSIFWLILVSFIYGVVHGFGPGHGKSLAFSYFLANKATIKQGLFLGGVIALAHTTMALFIVAILHLIIKKSFISSIDNINGIVRLASYSLIILIGLFLVIHIISKLIRSKNKEYQRPKKSGKNTSIVSLIIAIGIVPCQGAILILLFAISFDVLYLGVISILFLACGTAITISLSGIFSISARNAILKINTKRQSVLKFLENSFELFGASLMLFMGVFLLIGSLI